MITSLNHPLVKHFVKLRNDSYYRQVHQKVILESLKPILELQPFIAQLIFTQKYEKYVQEVFPRTQVKEEVMQKASGMKTAEGVLAEMQMPAFVSVEKDTSIIVFDGISDPGNMGTLLRTALAFGWQGAYFLPGGCDPFNEKVMRSARGAHFKLKLSKGTASQLEQLVQKQKKEAWVADLHGQEMENIQSSKPSILVMGNEAHGASQAIKNFCLPLTIPMSDQMESLNVAIAGGILLYALGKKGKKND